jgi:hypothetical protein
MDMSAHEVASRLEQLKSQAEEANVMHNAVLGHLGQIAEGLEGLHGRGFTPGNMNSAISLANEAKEKADENRSRIFSLLQGIEGMI